MAMATSCAAMVATTSPVFSSPCSRSARCTAHSSSSSHSQSSSAASTTGSSVKFPLSTTLRQFKTEAVESVSASGSTERPAILDPAMQYANLMWFKGSYNTQIFVSEDEPADSVVRRFRKAVMQAGVIPECRRRRFFETPQDIAKRKLLASQRRNKSRRFTPRPDSLGGDKKEGGAAKANEDDDYWGYTEETS